MSPSWEQGIRQVWQYRGRRLCQRETWSSGRQHREDRSPHRLVLRRVNRTTLAWVVDVLNDNASRGTASDESVRSLSRCWRLSLSHRGLLGIIPRTHRTIERATPRGTRDDQEFDESIADVDVLAKCLRDVSSIQNAFTAFERMRRDRRMKPRFFATPARLQAHHATQAELVVGFYKKGTGKPSVTWPESVDEALCFGWIDGVRRTRARGRLQHPLHAAKAYQHLERRQCRTPRRAREARKDDAGRSARLRGSCARADGCVLVRAHTAPTLAPMGEEKLRAKVKASAFFEAQPPCTAAPHWVIAPNATRHGSDASTNSSSTAPEAERYRRSRGPAETAVMANSRTGHANQGGGRLCSLDTHVARIGQFLSNR